MTTRDVAAVWLPWAAAALLWALNLFAGMILRLTPQIHALLNGGAITAAVGAIIWTAFRRFSGPRLKPGERVISDDEYHATEMALTRAIMAGRPGSGGEGEPRLRSVADL